MRLIVLFSILPIGHECSIMLTAILAVNENENKRLKLLQTAFYNVKIACSYYLAFMSLLCGLLLDSSISKILHMHQTISGLPLTLFPNHSSIAVPLEYSLLMFSILVVFIKFNNCIDVIDSLYMQ